MDVSVVDYSVTFSQNNTIQNNLFLFIDVTYRIGRVFFYRCEESFFLFFITQSPQKKYYENGKRKCAKTTLRERIKTNRKKSVMTFFDNAF